MLKHSQGKHAHNGEVENNKKNASGLIIKRDLGRNCTTNICKNDSEI